MSAEIRAGVTPLNGPRLGGYARGDIMYRRAAGDKLLIAQLLKPAQRKVHLGAAGEVARLLEMKRRPSRQHKHGIFERRLRDILRLRRPRSRRPGRRHDGQNLRTLNLECSERRPEFRRLVALPHQPMFRSICHRDARPPIVRRLLMRSFMKGIPPQSEFHECRNDTRDWRT